MQQSPDRDPSSIFVIHGRDEKARRALFEVLRSIGLKPLEWSTLLDRAGRGSSTIQQVVSVGFERCQDN
jgi:hypothetical protein